MNTNNTTHGKRGFTLTEIMMAIGVMSFVMAGSFAVYITAQKLWYSTSLYSRSSNKTSITLEKMIYGVKFNPYYPGIRAAIGSTVSMVTTSTSWVVKYNTPDTSDSYFHYDSAAKSIYFSAPGTNAPVMVGQNITSALISTNASGVNISLTTVYSEGRFTFTNTMSTYVCYRN